MRVLLVRFSAIGDCAMAAHTATCIRRSYPDAYLVWAVEERCSDVVDENALVTRRAIYPRERWKRHAWNPRTWREQWQFYRRLRQDKFDLGLDLQGHSKTAICLRLSGAKRRLAVRATDGFAGRLNPLYSEPFRHRHTVDRQLEALRSLDAFPGLPFPPIMPASPRLEPATPKRPPCVTIAIGAGQPWKAYPADAWDAVARALIRGGVRVVLVGGRDELPPGIEGAEDLVGRLTLAETMAQIAESDTVLAADTGAGHLAAAYGVPVVSLFGPTDPEEFRPYGPKTTVLQFGRKTADVPPEAVVAAAWRSLKRSTCAS